MKKIMVLCLMGLMVASAQAQCPGNLITNGAFETGVIIAPATSDYAYVDPLLLYLEDPGTYTVGTDPQDFHPAWTSYGDNTTGSGNMLIVNAATVADNPGVTVIWEQTGIAVDAGTQYTLTYWLASSYGTNLANVECSIEGDVSGSTTLGTQVAPGTTGLWIEVSYSWTAGASDTSATITLEDLTAAFDGDDFAIDDICFYAVKADIEKTVVPVGIVELGDHLAVTLVVDNPYDDPVTVVDEIPEGLAYIPGSFYVDTALQLDPSVVDNTLTTTVATGNHTLEFELQVVEVGYEDSPPLTNIAKVFAPEADPDVDEPDDTSESEVIILSPYDGFSKEVVDCNIDDVDHNPWDEVPWHTDVHWWILITVEDVDDEVEDMEDIVVTDNLGGDLELDAVDDDAYGTVPEPSVKKKKDNTETVGPVTIQWSGKTEKVHLSWAVGDEGDLTAVLTLEVSTKYNPGQKPKDPGVHGYTSLEDHDLNSGATLKFTDGDTGLQLSAHTEPLTVEAVE